MSRCFPFPPPGFVRNGFRDEALVDLIKREEKKAKKEKKKEGKREKKEKKEKEKKEKERQREKKERKRNKKEPGDFEIRKLGHKRQCIHDDTKGNKKTEEHCNRKVTVDEHLEKSSLTEERQLIGSQSSYESTPDSNKRQKQSHSPLNRPPFDDSRQYNNSESVIRIRLPVKRQKDPQVLISNEQPCSSSGRVYDEDAQEDGNFSNGSLEQLTLKACKEEPSKEKQHTLSDSSKPSTSRKSELVRSPNKCRMCPPSVILQYQTLVENWVPSCVQKVSTDADGGWLLSRSKSSIPATDRRERSSIGMCQEHPGSTWPKACFLPEADVYALPFTVPF